MTSDTSHFQGATNENLPPLHHPINLPTRRIEFSLSKSEIRNPDGSMVFSLDEVEVPLDWSQVATDILAQKYFRRAGVPARVRRVEEDGVPSFLWRSKADTAELASLPAAARYGSEHSAVSGLRPSRRSLDLLGLEAPLFRRSR